MILEVPDDWLVRAQRGAVASMAWQIARYHHLTRHDGACPICGTDDPCPNEKEKRWQLDHCHATGLIRGLLCRSCNVKIGKLERYPRMPKGYAGSDWLARAETYLRRCE